MTGTTSGGAIWGSTGGGSISGTGQNGTANASSVSGTLQNGAVSGSIGQSGGDPTDLRGIPRQLQITSTSAVSFEQNHKRVLIN